MINKMLSKHKTLLKNVSLKNSFKTDNGDLTNLRQLKSMLYQHGKKFYNQYTNDQNHFANWVEHVFDDPELAHSLRNTNDFNKTAKLIDDKLKYAELHIKHNESKEILYNYCRNMQNGKNFEPKFHRFDTLDNHDLSHVQEFLQNQNKDKFEQEMLKLLDYKPKRLSFFDRFFNKK